MIHYTSTRGGIAPVTFDEAVLSGFAADGGLFVPSEIPIFSKADLQELAGLPYQELAERILRCFIDPAVIPDQDLGKLLQKSFQDFTSDVIVPVTRLGETNCYVQELYHGPSLSFKDIAMGFLVNCMDYFCEKQGKRLSLILATTGDTGPAAAYASAGKKTLECWPLYPKNMISEEQERQMTTLGAENVHPVGVEGCENGGDDLDLVVAKLFSDPVLKEELRLSSVNSINWCRVMVQTVHYFHGYFTVADSVGEEVVVSVPTGAFGNLCAGYIARSMGLPVKTFVCATNDNGTLDRVFREGKLTKESLKQTVSSAIDIVIPYNFWRFLYFNCDADPQATKQLMDEFEQTGSITFDTDLWQRFNRGFVSAKISDQDTLATMRDTHARFDYLLDPHGAVAVAAAQTCSTNIGPDDKVICLATAHPAKFPDIVARAIGSDTAGAANHPSIEQAKLVFQHLRTCRYEHLESALTAGIQEQLRRCTGSGQ